MLIQSCTAHGVQKNFALIQPERQMLDDPCDRDVGLRAAQVLQRGLGQLDLTRHRSGGSEHPVGGGEVGALTDRLAREPYRLVIIASDELGVGGDAATDRGERGSRAQS